MDDDFTTVAKVLAALRAERRVSDGIEWCNCCHEGAGEHDADALCARIEAILRDNATVGSPVR